MIIYGACIVLGGFLGMVIMAWLAVATRDNFSLRSDSTLSGGHCQDAQFLLLQGPPKGKSQIPQSPVQVMAKEPVVMGMEEEASGQEVEVEWRVKFF